MLQLLWENVQPGLMLGVKEFDWCGLKGTCRDQNPSMKLKTFCAAADWEKQTACESLDRERFCSPDRRRRTKTKTHAIACRPTAVLHELSPECPFSSCQKVSHRLLRKNLKAEHAQAKRKGTTCASDRQLLENEHQPERSWCAVRKSVPWFGKSSAVKPWHDCQLGRLQAAQPLVWCNQPVRVEGDSIVENHLDVQA